MPRSRNHAGRSRRGKFWGISPSEARLERLGEERLIRESRMPELTRRAGRHESLFDRVPSHDHRIFVCASCGDPYDGWDPHECKTLRWKAFNPGKSGDADCYTSPADGDDLSWENLVRSHEDNFGWWEDDYGL